MLENLIYYNMYKIFDLHNDYFLKLSTDSKKDKYVNSHDSHIVSAIWTSSLNTDESLAEIERARDYVNSHERLFLSVEDLHFLNRKNLERFISFRPVYAGLTWNTTNCLAGGNHESGRLTSFGKTAIKHLEGNRIKIDTAHLNEESFMDVSKVTNKPMFCSHTAFYGLHSNSRNLKDYQLKMIVDSGGLVGLCLVSDFINGTKKCEIKDVVSHIDYFACKFGVDNIALGTDFYGTNHLPKSINNYKKLSSKLSQALECLGYTEKAISKIFYDNAYAFFFA